MIWLVFAFLTGVAVMAVLAPLAMRGGSKDASAADIAFFEEQIAEIERERAEGELEAAEAEAAKTEAARRFGLRRLGFGGFQLTLGTFALDFGDLLLEKGDVGGARILRSAAHGERRQHSHDRDAGEKREDKPDHGPLFKALRRVWKGRTLRRTQRKAILASPRRLKWLQSPGFKAAPVARTGRANTGTSDAH